MLYQLRFWNNFFIICSTNAFVNVGVRFVEVLALWQVCTLCGRCIQVYSLWQVCTNVFSLAGGGGGGGSWAAGGLGGRVPPRLLPRESLVLRGTESPTESHPGADSRATTPHGAGGEQGRPEPCQGGAWWWDPWPGWLLGLRLLWSGSSGALGCCGASLHGSIPGCAWESWLTLTHKHESLASYLPLRWIYFIINRILGIATISSSNGGTV